MTRRRKRRMSDLQRYHLNLSPENWWRRTPCVYPDILLRFLKNWSVRTRATLKTSGLLLTKKYIDQEPPYLMRQICVLQWEEIKTKNSGATRHLCGGRGWIWKYCYCRYEHHGLWLWNSLCYLKFCELNDLKAEDVNNININQEDCL